MCAWIEWTSLQCTEDSFWLIFQWLRAKIQHAAELEAKANYPYHRKNSWDLRMNLTFYKKLNFLEFTLWHSGLKIWLQQVTAEGQFWSPAQCSGLKGPKKRKRGRKRIPAYTCGFFFSRGWNLHPSFWVWAGLGDSLLKKWVWRGEK